MSEAFNKLLESMTDLSKLSPLFRGLFYGDPGCGKTVLAFQVAQALRGNGEILYVDTATGYATLAINSRWQHLRENVTRIPFKSVEQLLALAAARQMDERFSKYTVLILDETTTMAQRDTVAVSQDPKRKDAKERGHPDEITWPDRNISYQRIMRATSELANCDWHIIHLAHITADKKMGDLIDVKHPSFGPKQIVPLLAPLQLVGLCNNDGTDYKVQCRSTQRAVAKTQMDQLGTEATYPEVIEAIRGYVTSKVNETLPVAETVSEPVAIEVD